MTDSTAHEILQESNVQPASAPEHSLINVEPSKNPRINFYSTACGESIPFGMTAEAMEGKTHTTGSVIESPDKTNTPRQGLNSTNISLGVHRIYDSHFCLLT